RGDSCRGSRSSGCDGTCPAGHGSGKTSDELRAIERHRLLAVAVPVILPAEADLAVVHGQQPVVGDGDTGGVASDIIEDLSWPGERPLRVDNPLGLPNGHQIPAERGWFMKVAVR